MRVLLPYAAGLCKPRATVLNLDIPAHFDMANALATGNFWQWEREVLAVLLGLASTCKDTSFLDAGANIGIYSLVMGMLFSNEIPITAVEANPDLVNYIRQLADLNGVVLNVYENAITSADQEILEFNISVSDSGSSLKDLHSNLKEKIKVHTISLSRIFYGFNIIKIDTEGTEYDALMSGEHELIEHKPYILIEILNKDNFAQINKLAAHIPYRIFHLKKDFGIVEIAEYPDNRKAGEYNFLLCAGQLSDDFMNAHARWQDAIRQTSYFELPEYKPHFEQYRLFLEYLKSELGDVPGFIYFPIGKTWLALYSKDVDRLVHYEFMINRDKFSINLHFETGDTNLNTSLRDRMYHFFKNHSILRGMEGNLTNWPNITGFNIEYPFMHNVEAVKFYASTMKTFIYDTAEHLIQQYKLMKK